MALLAKVGTAQFGDLPKGFRTENLRTLKALKKRALKSKDRVVLVLIEGLYRPGIAPGYLATFWSADPENAPRTAKELHADPDCQLLVEITAQDVLDSRTTQLEWDQALWAAKRAFGDKVGPNPSRPSKPRVARVFSVKGFVQGFEVGIPKRGNERTTVTFLDGPYQGKRARIKNINIANTAEESKKLVMEEPLILIERIDPVRYQARFDDILTEAETVPTDQPTAAPAQPTLAGATT